MNNITGDSTSDIEDEEIQVIHVFDTPLYPWMQLLKGNVKHCFVVFKSSNWYWSLEKNSSEFVVQRFARIKDVKDKIGGADRLYRVSLRGFSSLNLFTYLLLIKPSWNACYEISPSLPSENFQALNFLSSTFGFQ